MPNKANFRKSQMLITATVTMNCSEKPTLDTWSKQTQSKPILPAMAGKIALPARHSFSDGGSEVEGPVVKPNKKGPAFQQGPWFFHPLLLCVVRCAARVALDGAHFGCFGAFFPLCRFVLYRLAFIKRPYPLRDIRVMDKQILTATIGSDKTISFSLIEPFYCTFFQNFFSLGPKPVLQCKFPHIFSLGIRFRGTKVYSQNGPTLLRQPPSVNKKLLSRSLHPLRASGTSAGLAGVSFMYFDSMPALAFEANKIIRRSLRHRSSFLR